MRIALLITLLALVLAASLASASPLGLGLRVGMFQPMGSDLEVISDNWTFFGLEYGAGGVPTPWATIPLPFGERTVTVDYMKGSGDDGLNHYEAKMIPVLYRLREPLSDSFYWGGGIGISFNDFEANGIGDKSTDFAYEVGLGLLLGKSAVVELDYCNLGSGRGLDASGARLALTWFF